VKGAKRKDIYLEVAKRVQKRVNYVDDEFALWWRTFFNDPAVNDTHIRKLCKQPVMTFGYGVTRVGMVRQLAEAYGELNKKLRRNNWPEEGAFGYLADQIDYVATKELLRGPQKVMEYVKSLADHCASKGTTWRGPQNPGLMEWTSSTGFPCVNRYQEGNIETASLGRGTERVRNLVGVGWGKEILVDDALNGAAPNFVHSQDAAHLAHTVNGFPKDILTVHDSFSCHASNVEDLHFAIRAALVGIYMPEDYRDWLAELRGQNVSSDDILLDDVLPPPPMGDLDDTDVIKILYLSPYAFD